MTKTDSSDYKEKFMKLNQFFVFCMVVGLVSLAIGVYLDPRRVWINILVDNFYFLSLSLCGIFFIALHTVVKASWWTPFRKLSEAVASFFPLAAVSMLVLIPGIHTLYEWSHKDAVAKDPILTEKAVWLNEGFFIARLVVIVVVWLLLSRLIMTLSKKENYKALYKWSIVFLVLFGPLWSIACWDWLMSIAPHWFSTIFAAYNWNGMFVAGLSAITLLALIFWHKGYLQGVNENHFHDLGKVIFAFSTFWAYLWFSQYMLIWYSNIPEETTYYLTQLHNDWNWLFYFNVVLNWCVPFLWLMSRNSKRTRYVLFRVCIVLMVGHWLDIYMQVGPTVYKHAGIHDASVGWLEVGMALGYMGVFGKWVFAYMQNKKDYREKDPYLAEGLALHQ